MGTIQLINPKVDDNKIIVCRMLLYHLLLNYYWTINILFYILVKNLKLIKEELDYISIL